MGLNNINSFRDSGRRPKNDYSKYFTSAMKESGRVGQVDGVIDDFDEFVAKKFVKDNIVPAISPKSIDDRSEKMEQIKELLEYIENLGYEKGKE